MLLCHHVMPCVSLMCMNADNLENLYDQCTLNPSTQRATLLFFTSFPLHLFHPLMNPICIQCFHPTCSDL